MSVERPFKPLDNQIFDDLDKYFLITIQKTIRIIQTIFPARVQSIPRY